MSEAAHRLPMFADGVVGFTSAAKPYLLGAHCATCERWFFPQGQRCRHCGSALLAEPLGSTGTIYSFTVVRTKPPLGLPRPYALAYVDLDERPLRILMLLDPKATHLSIGTAVELSVDPLGVNLEGAACLRPYFRPRNS